MTDESLKILVIGASASGKGSLIHSYVRNGLDGPFTTTVGVEFQTKRIVAEGRPVKLNIWDTAGQERYRVITKASFYSSHGILLVFDVSRRDMFDETPTWIDSIREACGDSTPHVILVGNIGEAARAVAREEAEALAAQFQLPYFETDVKDMKTVSEAFHAVAKMALERKRAMADALDPSLKQSVTITDPETKEGQNCQC
jgi:small GTP-binding protein